MLNSRKIRFIATPYPYQVGLTIRVIFILNSLIAQQIGTTARWYSNKTPLNSFSIFFKGTTAAEVILSAEADISPEQG